MLPELAWTRVQLAILDGPQQAFDAITASPPADQDELWLELFRVCFGRGDTAASDTAAVAAQITSPALRRKIELEALQSNIPLRPAADILAEIQKKLNAAASRARIKIRAFLVLADTHRRATGPEAAAIPLHAALEATKALRDPVQRATLLAELTELLPDALLFEESKQALQDATEAARSIVAPDQRVPPARASSCGTPSMPGKSKQPPPSPPKPSRLAPKIKLSPPLLPGTSRIPHPPRRLACRPQPAPRNRKQNPVALAPDGQPSKSYRTEHPLPSTPPPPAQNPDPRRALLDSIATTAAEDTIGYTRPPRPPGASPSTGSATAPSPTKPPPPSYLPGVPAGSPAPAPPSPSPKACSSRPYPRQKPNFPNDLPGPLDLLPGQSPDVPVIPENPDAK